MSPPSSLRSFGRHGATARRRPHRCGCLMRFHRTMAATVATLLILALASTPGCSASALLPHRQRQLLQGSREGCAAGLPAASMRLLSDVACQMLHVREHLALLTPFSVPSWHSVTQNLRRFSKACCSRSRGHPPVRCVRRPNKSWRLRRAHLPWRLQPHHLQSANLETGFVSCPTGIVTSTRGPLRRCRWQPGSTYCTLHSCGQMTMPRASANSDCRTRRGRTRVACLPRAATGVRRFHLPCLCAAMWQC